MVGVGGGYNALMGDGQTLYTSPMYGPAPFVTSPECDGRTWTPQSGQMFGTGPFERAFDSTHSILYSSSWNTGLLALRVR